MNGSDLTFFDDPQLDRVVSVLFELGRQLHAERAHRLALEHLLVSSGVVDLAALDELGGDPAYRAATTAALDAAMNGLFRAIDAGGPPEHPLREEAA